MAKKAKVKISCLHCCKVFEIHECETKRPSRPTPRYCSRSCYATHYQAAHGGMNLKNGTTRHRGYVLDWAPDHPANVRGYVPQHRIIVEKSIGRYLQADEEVHHINHVKDDNRLENLQLLTRMEHRKLHGVEKKKLITVDGVSLSLLEWSKSIPADFSYMKKMRKYNGWTSEETINYMLYVKLKRL